MFPTPRALTFGALSAILAALLLLAVPAAAQEETGLTPSFGNGVLTVTGGGFQPGEQVTLTVRLRDRTEQFQVTADAQGRFRLETGLAVPPGSPVELVARGDQGTEMAAITSGPGGFLPPAPVTAPGASPTPARGAPTVPAPAASSPGRPTQLPRTGLSAGPGLLAPLAVAGSLLLGLGLAARRSRRGERTPR